jgi:putative membrane protein
MSAMKPMIAALGCAIVLLVPGSTLNAQDTSRTRESVRSPWDLERIQTVPSAAMRADSALIRQATIASLLEVRLGELAPSRASDSAVKTFAREMVEEHGSMQEQWKEVAARNGLRLESSLGAAEESEINRLTRLSGSAFDQAYMTSMIRHHEENASTLQRLGPSAKSDNVRRLAASGVTAIQEHLALARQVGSRVGVSSTIAGRQPDKSREVDNFRTGNAGNKPAEDDDRSVSERDRDDHAGLRADRDFVREVVADHGTQIRLAERAQRDARSSETKRFAEQLRTDLTKWQERWQALATRNGLKVSEGLGEMHRQKVVRLEKASRSNVDRTYAAIVVDHLESIVPYFQKEGRSARSAAVRRLVEDELPVIREHLAKARRLEAQTKDRADASKRND